MAKQKDPSAPILTPIGIANFPKLNSPDTKFDADGVYEVRIALPDAEAKPLIDAALEVRARMKTLQEALRSDPNREIKLAPDVPWRQAKDRAKNPVPGMMEFHFKMKATFKLKDEKEADGRPKMGTARPLLFDAMNKPIDPKVTIIRGGSRVKVAGTIASYYTDKLGVGVTLRLQAVQVIELAKDRDAASFGFGQEAGGYGDEAPTFENEAQGENAERVRKMVEGEGSVPF